MAPKGSFFPSKHQKDHKHVSILKESNKNIVKHCKTFVITILIYITMYII